MGTGDLNSGPHAYTASILPTEQIPSPQQHLFLATEEYLHVNSQRISVSPLKLDSVVGGGEARRRQDSI